MATAAMVVWVDAQISPRVASWMADTLEVRAIHVSALGLRSADDPTIFEAAREANVVFITKDGDFVQLLERHGPPPRVLWLHSGNTSNAHLRTLLDAAWARAVVLFNAGEALVEINERVP